MRWTRGDACHSTRLFGSKSVTIAGIGRSIGQVVLWLQLAIEDRRSVTIIDEARAKRILRNERFMEAENAKTR